MCVDMRMDLGMHLMNAGTRAHMRARARTRARPPSRPHAHLCVCTMARTPFFMRARARTVVQGGAGDVEWMDVGLRAESLPAGAMAGTTVSDGGEFD